MHSTLDLLTKDTFAYGQFYFMEINPYSASNPLIDDI